MTANRTTIGLGFIIGLGLILRILYAVWIYEPTLVAYHNGDYNLYRIAAEEILQGDLAFTNSLYLVRPPLFPLLVALLGLQPLLILAVNIVLSTAIIPLTYLLAQQFGLSKTGAALAALIVALNPTSIKYAGVLLPEPLANFLLALFYLALMHLYRLGRDNRSMIGFALICGLLLALAALARPAAYLLWLPVGFWLLLVQRRHWRSAAVFLLVALAGTSVWQVHNYVVFNNSSYSTIGTYNMLYYRAASVLYQQGEQDIDTVYTELARRVEERLGNDTSAVDAGTRYAHTAPPSETEAAMQQTAFEVFLNAPLVYIKTIPVGLYRILLNTTGFPGILQIVVFVWNAALIVAASMGIGLMWRRGDYAEAAILFLLCAYFVLGTLWVQTSGIDTRATAMLTPLLAVSAGQVLMYRRHDMPPNPAT